jgi:hypothetical protein
VSQRTLGNACRSTVGEAIAPAGLVVFAEIIPALIRVSAGTETDPRALNHKDKGLGPLAAARWGYGLKIRIVRHCILQKGWPCCW